MASDPLCIHGREISCLECIDDDIDAETTIAALRAQLAAAKRALGVAQMGLEGAESIEEENTRLRAALEAMSGEFLSTRKELDRLKAALADTEEIARQMQVPTVGRIQDHYRRLAEVAVATIKRAAGLEP